MSAVGPWKCVLQGGVVGPRLSHPTLAGGGVGLQRGEPLPWERLPQPASCLADQVGQAADGQRHLQHPGTRCGRGAPGHLLHRQVHGEGVPERRAGPGEDRSLQGGPHLGRAGGPLLQQDPGSLTVREGVGLGPRQVFCVIFPFNRGREHAGPGRRGLVLQQAGAFVRPPSQERPGLSMPMDSRAGSVRPGWGTVLSS